MFYRNENKLDNTFNIMIASPFETKDNGYYVTDYDGGWDNTDDMPDWLSDHNLHDRAIVGWKQFENPSYFRRVSRDILVLYCDGMIRFWSEIEVSGIVQWSKIEVSGIVQ